MRVAAETDVAYAMILDRDGRVAAHNHRPEMMGTVVGSGALDRILSSDATVVQEIDGPNGEALYDFTVPIQVNAQPWGTARVGLSRRRMDVEIVATRRQLVLLAILVLGGAGLASALVARRIAGPVRQLAAGAAGISRGELVQRVEPTTWDEIGQLATAFNEMARQLHEQRSALLEGRTALEAAHAELRRRFGELSDLKSYTDHILESLANGIVTLDLDGRVVTLNGAAETLLGCPAVAAARGRPVAEVLGHAPEVVALLQAAIQWRMGRTATVTLPGRQGSVVPVEATTATLKGGEGQDLGVMLIVRDLTAVRALEAQLRQAQKMEAVGRLAGGVAHDFNNLLTVITGCSQLLLLKLPPESPRRRRRRARQEAADRAAALTRQLLAFSRKQMLAAAGASISTRWSAAWRRCCSRLIGEDVELVTRLDARGGPRARRPRAARADDRQPGGQRARRHAARAAGSTIETSNVELDEDSAAPARRRSARAPTSLWPCSDTGHRHGRGDPGASFEPFFTTKEPGKGTGLGLATVYGIVSRAAGAIRVDSEPGQGAVFTIDLPRVDAAADLRRATAASRRPPLAARRRCSSWRTSPRSAGSRGDILHQQGYTVLEAADGDDALRIGREHGGPIHLLVTDVVMPQMGGRELADHLTPDAAGDEGALHVGLHRRRHRPQGRLGDRHRLPAEAVHGCGARPQGARGPRRRARERRPLAQGSPSPGRGARRRAPARPLSRPARRLPTRTPGSSPSRPARRGRWRGRTSTRHGRPRARGEAPRSG